MRLRMQEGGAQKNRMRRGPTRNTLSKEWRRYGEVLRTFHHCNDAKRGPRRVQYGPFVASHIHWHVHTTDTNALAMKVHCLLDTGAK